MFLYRIFFNRKADKHKDKPHKTRLTTDNKN